MGSRVQKTAKEEKQTIFTIGHSTRAFEEFLKLLRAHGIQGVIDIRTIPGSRHNPQYSIATLGPSLKAAGIDYLHLKDLGGLRRPKPDSKNIGWRNASFRGYADHMGTPEFEAALSRAIELSQNKPTVLMCAEAVPWRCHRSLVADALTARDIPVKHIMSEILANQHEQTPFAQVRRGKVTYHSEKPVLRKSATGVSRQQSKLQLSF
ncbi:MAG TPA: DUF488 domain-containing protein [Candidatus Binatus sp.]|nr:DUF488 domain-containing protein [Candidatus Binatus sp.]